MMFVLNGDVSVNFLAGAIFGLCIHLSVSDIMKIMMCTNIQNKMYLADYLGIKFQVTGKFGMAVVIFF